MSASHILDRFLSHSRAFPERPALWIDGTLHNYGDVEKRVSEIAAMIEADGTSAPLPFIADRSFASYATTLAATLAGRPFVPLSPRNPPRRNLMAWLLAGADALAFGATGAKTAAATLALTDETTTLFWLDHGPPPTDDAFIGHSARAVSSVARPTPRDPDIQASDHAAYILFTSGSSGDPKGVAVSHANLMAYVDTVLELYRPTPDDRFGHVFDQSFDLSIHDLFVALSAGACLYVVPAAKQMAPAGFARERALTFWFSTPSTAAIMDRIGSLQGGSLPDLRVSLFCGEALSTHLAYRWAVAAPNSRVDNLYGPTETTIAILRHTVERPPDGREVREQAKESAIVPIGLPFPGQATGILGSDDRFYFPADGLTGELVISGSQVSLGYWKDVDLTAERFPTALPGAPAGTRWYRTGDRVAYRRDVGYAFLGRLDDQVKIRGHRVELGEIERVLREVAGGAAAAAIAWPTTSGGADGVVGFVCAPGLSESALRRACADRLPDYIVPRRVLIIEEMPLTVSGKIDRKSLVASLAKERARP